MTAPRNLRTIPVNPIAKLRKQLGMFQNGFAKAAGVSPSTIYYVEKGMFGAIPDRVHNYLSERIEDYSIAKMEREYNKWIMAKRSLNSNVIPSATDIYSGSLSKEALEEIKSTHPLMYYLEHYDLNPSKFCDLICIPKSPFYSYVKGTQEHMPNIIWGALIDSGMSSTSIRLLDRMGAEYYRYTQEKRITDRREHDRSNISNITSK